MKRKRGDEDGNKTVRPLYRREELLCITVELVLNYNRVFREAYTDLTLYHHAERNMDTQTLWEYNKFLYDRVANLNFVSKYEIMKIFNI